MLEVECRHVPHCQQKIVLFLSDIRHFAETLRVRGLRVDYVRLDDPATLGSFTGEVERALALHQAQRLVLTEPGKLRLQVIIEG